MATFFGVAFSFATPPLDPADELRHLQRAFLLSEGRVLPPGRAPGHEGAIPRSLVRLHQPPSRWVAPDGRIHEEPVRGAYPICSHDLRTLLGQWRDPLEADARTTLPTSTPQGALAYVPQALLLAPARLLELPPVAILYLGRLANVLTWVLAGGLAIRLLPFRRWSIALVCLSPMAVFLSGSLSADTPTNAAALVFLALVLHIGLPARPVPVVSRRQLLALTGAAALLGGMKPGYGVLAGAVLLIPGARFASSRQRWSAVGAVLLATSATSILWMLALWHADQVFPVPDPAARLEELVRSPVLFLERALTTLSRRGLDQLAGFVGVLGHLDVLLPRAVYVGYPIALLGVTLLDGPDPPAWNLARRGLLLGLLGLGTLAVLAQLYVGAGRTEVMAIPGLQGRHFIPLAPLLLLALPARRALPEPMGGWLVAALSGLVLLVGLGGVVSHYYP